MALRYTVALVTMLVGAQAAAAADATDGAYCSFTGGVLQVRRPEYGTNGGTPLPLAKPRVFCQWTREKDGSRISVLLETLLTRQPTLAALAYYAKVTYDGSTCKGSPGSCYCSQLGGTDLFGGINAAGGG